MNDTAKIKDHLTVKFPSGNDMDWLGIHISRGRVKKSITLSQTNYIERILSKFKSILHIKEFKNETTPARHDLFEADDKCKTDTLQFEFLSILMSIAFLAYRTKPDLLTVVSFLATRVIHNDPNDREALIRLI